MISITNPVGLLECALSNSRWQITYSLVLTMLLSLGLATSLAAQDRQTLGQQAEQAGKLREALTYYVAALQDTPERSDAEQRLREKMIAGFPRYLQQAFQDADANQLLREKIIALVQKLKPPPAVPEEAERHMARGRAAVKAARDPKDFEDAIREFRAALRLAPWLPEGYYNLGVVQDKAAHFADAIANLKLYLLAAPDAPDAKQVRDLIFEAEYRRDKAEKEAAAKQEEEARNRAEQAVLDRFKRLVEGRTYEERWCNRVNPWSDEGVKTINSGTFGCTLQEYSGNNWYRASWDKPPDEGGGTHRDSVFEFPEDGTITLCDRPWHPVSEFTPECPNHDGFPSFVGVVEGSNDTDIHWFEWDSDKKTKGRRLWVRYESNWMNFTVSGERPWNDVGFDPSRKYRYEYYKVRQ